MAQNITTTVELPPAIETWYDTLLLVRLQSKLIHEQFAEIRNQPGKTGNTIKFRRYSNLSPATTKLTEGQTPDGSPVGTTDLTAVTAQYGDFVTITDIVDLTVQDAVMTEVASLLGDQAGQTRDILVKDMLEATASTTDATNGANGNSPTEITGTDIAGVVQVLLSNNALMRTSVVSATPGVGTLPVREAYWGTINSDLLTNDLENVTGNNAFLHASEYPDQGPRLATEWGSTGNVRWVHATNAAKDEDVTPTEYKTNIIGMNAYATTSITGGTLEFIVQQFGMGDDPLRQRMTSGWKFNHTARILNDNAMHALNVTAT